ncbi:cytochrome P450 [Roridomyces roridus]|uniref:Cytochrome P450 n=1 Tax=Roridomyces roridus TaxID=1738132 RepID=A0AAD7CKD4_9AGAR|nr:cytochrome P450 [Roridomyces roridus]
MSLPGTLMCKWCFVPALLGLPLLLFKLLCLRKRKLPTPPGPRISFFSWGNTVAMPNSYQWLTYAAWKKTYGDFIFLNAFRNHILVLNSVQVAQDLLDKRSAIYSSRPVRVMMTELMGFDFLFTGMKYNSWYKQHRTMFQHHFHHTVVPRYQYIQEKHAHTLLRNLAFTPDGALEHNMRRTTAALVLEICYGIHVADAGDEYVALADKALAGISLSGNFGTFMVDYFPFLKHVPAWMPGAKFKRDGLRVREFSRGLLNYAFDSTKQKLERGCAEPSLMTMELESLFRDAPQKSRWDEREKIIKDVVATAYAAGSDTTLSTLLSFVLAMVLHPEVQAKACVELDRVVPKDRLPDFSDRDQLPYINCIAWECLRWQPAVNIALGHYLTEEDEYQGYRIPKGTTCLANLWAMLHDPKRYPEPFEFNPDRFVDSAANHAKSINPVPEFEFGFGRRQCPGRFLALDTIWIVIATTLYSYRILKALDGDGKEIEPRVEYTTGLISLPRPFKYRVVPRSAEIERLIEATRIE